MAEDINFADASFEPTDEDLAALAKEAFEHVGDEAQRALAAFHDEISRLRQQAIERVGHGDTLESA
jgi:hypothetical protein